MRVVWALVVGWCVVTATTAPTTRDAHRAGWSAATAPAHHVVRHRVAIGSFVAPSAIEVVGGARVATIVKADAVLELADASSVIATARGPPSLATRV